MVLKEKEKQAIKDLQTLEQACIDKYDKYTAQAKDPVLQPYQAVTAMTVMAETTTQKLPTANLDSLKIRRMMPFLQQTVSPAKSSHPLNITAMYSYLATVRFVSF